MTGFYLGYTKWKLNKVWWRLVKFVRKDEFPTGVFIIGWIGLILVAYLTSTAVWTVFIAIFGFIPVFIILCLVWAAVDIIATRSENREEKRKERKR